MPPLRLVSLIVLGVAAAAQAQHRGFVPVTTQMLRQPSPNDWLMYSRTYDAQRFSPLEQIDTSNVHRLGLVWTRSIGSGNTETIPLVYDGVMYVVNPGARVQALDATTGNVIWEYARDVPSGVAATARTKNLAIYADVIIYTAPDSVVVGLDARTGRGRSCRRLVDGRAAGDPPGLPMGVAGQLRRGAQVALLGHRQSDAGPACCPSRRRCRRHGAVVARGSLQQLDGRARSCNRQAYLVLPARAGGRLGSRPDPQADARAHARGAGPALRPMD